MSAKTARATKTEANVVCPSHLEGSTLPPDWEWVSLGNVCRTTSGGTPSRKKKEYFEGDIPWVKSGELPDGPVSEIEEYITGEAVKNSSAKQFPKGTLLIALYGATVGKLGVLTQEAATNQAVCAIFPPDHLETKYLFWYLRFVRSDLIAQAIGGAQPNISQGILRNLMIPVAPPSQQKRIVAEIEKQFSRLNEAVANLKRVKANLKRYKAAVLKAAVEGRLTEEWRKQHPNAKLYICERGASTLSLGVQCSQPLPRGWAWWQLREISERVSVGHVGPTSEYYCDKGQGIPFIRSQNVRPGKLDLEDGRYIQKSFHERLKKSQLKTGDLLVVRVGANRGDTCIVPAGHDQLNCANIVFARPFEGISKYLQVYFQSEPCQQALLDLTTGSAQGVLNTKSVAEAPIPVPPLEEQDAIVAEVERRLSVIEELEAAVEANLTRADRLRQSVLHQTFTGRLWKRPLVLEAVN